MSTTPQLPSEMELLKILKNSDACKKFKLLQLPHKINREQQAWNFICEHRGKYSEDILSRIFDILDTPAKTDIDKKVRPWFGQTLNKPNRNNIFKHSMNHINDWIETLLFSNISPDKALNICLHDNIKITGANKGIITILLYLSSPSQYNIWLNKTEKGLVLINYHCCPVKNRIDSTGYRFRP